MSPSSFYFPTAICRILGMSRFGTGGFVAAAALFAIACGVGDKGADGREAAGMSFGGERSRVAAIVDGETIGVDEVRFLIDATDAGLDASSALDALIDERLLAEEAERRGFGGSEVEVARERAMVRRLIEKEGDEVTPESLDENRLRDIYEGQKARFVHGPLRRVVHAVALFAKSGVDDPAAKSLAEEIGRAVSGAAGEEEFRARAKPFQDRKDVKVNVESLPAFSAEETGFVREFVKAAFAVPGVGKLSPPFRSSFGWHVLLVLDEMPAESIPFEKAKATIAEEVLPFEKKRRFDALLERLSKEHGVFVYEKALGADRETP